MPESEPAVDGSLGESPDAERLAFQRHFEFVPLWNAHGMWPVPWWEETRSSHRPDPDEPTEHVRYGAFRWWLTQPLDDERLNRLIDLMALDPDMGMAGAALHQLLGLPQATEAHAQRFQASTARSSKWRWWYAEKPNYAVQLWHDIRADQAKRRAHADTLARVEADAQLPQPQLSVGELLDLYAQDDPWLMLALIAHPLLPMAQLQALAQWRDRAQAKKVRTAAEWAIAQRERATPTPDA